MNKIKLFSLLLIIPLAAVAIVGYLRFSASEDNWICEKGQWVKHGNPSFPVPAFPCQSEGQKVSDEEQIGMANPASKNCVEKGGRLEQVQETAGIVGICKFSDGTECEEWQFFRDECKKGQYTKADTSHPYSGFIKQRGNQYILKDESGLEYSLVMPEKPSKEFKIQLAGEMKSKEAVTIIAAETPPLSKILILKSFQEK